ncbi:lanthionine synthetase-like protein [Chitinophaga sp. S165]|nr:lanthionine synthetase-like protein [Chitinophaga sp. S165]
MFEHEIYRIADTLLTSLQQDEDGSYWQRKRVSEDGVVTYLPETTDIFNGSAGTLLFFLDLYRYQPDSRYIDCCNNVLDRLLRKTYTTVPAYYTFYTGATGLIYLCIRMYEATGIYRYIEQGIQLAIHLKNGFSNGVVKDDLLSGHAGNLLAISYLYAHSGEMSLVNIIKDICDILINHARISDTGLKWDNEKFAYDSLTGFSHGAAGIAYALLETGRYFKDETLCWLGEQALAYEMQYYDAEKNNWMDLRLNSLRIPPGEIIDWDLLSFKPRMSDACSWAHGATGATLSRLHAYHITGNTRYAEQANLGIQRTLRDISAPSRNNYTLCSGYGGHILLLLKASDVLVDASLYTKAVMYAQNALHFFRRHGTYNTYSAATHDDPALLSGLAGIGYLYLQFLLPYRGNTVLHPQIPGDVTDHGSLILYNIAEVKANILGAHFKQTLSLQQPDIICWKRVQNIQELEQYLLRQICNDPQIELSEIFEFERGMTTLWKMHKGMLCYRKKGQQLQSICRKIIAYDDNTLLNKKLVLCSHVKIHSAQAGYKVMYCQEQGVSILSVNRLPGLILSQLQQAKTINDVVNNITAHHFPGQSTDQQQQIVIAILGQVRLLLQYGLLTAA